MSGMTMDQLYEYNTNRILAAIRTNPATAAQVADLIGLGGQIVVPRLRKLHESGRVHIAGYDRSSRRPVPRYLAGEGVDASRDSVADDSLSAAELHEFMYRMCSI